MRTILLSLTYAPSSIIMNEVNGLVSARQTPLVFFCATMIILPTTTTSTTPTLTLISTISTTDRLTHLGCAIRIRGHSASGTNTNTNAMSKDECANGEVAVTLCVFLNMPTLF